MRTRDRERAAIRRTRQLGENDDAYMQRIARQLQQETGLQIEIEKDSSGFFESFLVHAYRPRDHALMAQVTVANLANAAAPIRWAAERLKAAKVY